MSARQAQALSNFYKYLQVKSVHPNPDYKGCIEFLKTQASELKLSYEITEIVQKKPIFVMTLPGECANLPSILLVSHMDVVPVFPELWKYDPFSAHKDDQGNIYARGSQDMKCVGIQYLEALRKLNDEGKTFLRTIHLAFMPDEEISGADGMAQFVHHENFKKLNVGVAMDEGVASPDETFDVYNGERSIWWLWVKCPGQPGHGSVIVQDSAAEKFRRIVNTFLDFRATEEAKFKKGAPIGEVITVNLTTCEGSPQMNVVPSAMYAGFDIRIPPTINFDEFENRIKAWCASASADITYSFKEKNMNQKVTSTDSVWWKTFKATTEKMGLTTVLKTFQGATDSRFLRAVDIPAIGFSPMNNTPILLHDNNEFLNEKIFLRGIDIYAELIPNLANVPQF